MANDLLITAIRESDLDLDEIADVAGVDNRTVQRWLGGRVPHPRYRVKVAGALGLEERELWPETGRARGKDGLAEIVGAFARRSDADAPDWRALMRAAERQVDLVGYSLLHVAEARAINKLLSAKAADGCRIRIALASADSEHVFAADSRQRPSGRLVGRIKNARKHFLPLGSEPRIELREHQVASSHTILRFDERMLVTIHLYGTPGFQAPMLHLRRERDYGIFDQLAKHIEDLWQSATPITLGMPDADREQAPQASPAGSDDLLDRLDYVWRPSR